MKNSFKFICLISAILLIASIFTGCSDGVFDENYAYKSSLSEAQEAPKMSENTVTSEQTSNQNTQKYVVTAAFECETKNFDVDQADLKAKVDGLGGYFENFSITGKDYENYSTKRIKASARIPKEKFDEFSDYLNEKFEVTAQTSEKKNITESYYEAQSHYDTLKVSEERLLELLKEAKNLDEMLKLENQLAGIRQQIQYYDSLIKSLDNQVDYATVSIAVSAVYEYSEPKSETFLTKVGNAFVTSWKNFANGCGDFATWLVSAIPTLVVIAIIIFAIIFIIKLLIRRSRKKQAKQYNSINGK